MSNTRGSPQLLRVRLTRFLQWWKATLLDVLPGTLTELAAGDMRSIRIFSALETVSLVDHRQRELLKVVWERSEGRWKLDEAWQQIATVMRTRPVELYLAESEILRQEVYLPHAALVNLNGAVRHCLPTWSPFSPDDVHVAAVHVGSGHQARVELRYAMREVIDPILSKAADQGLHVDRIILGDDRWNVAITEQTARIKRQQWIDGVLAAGAILLAAFVLQTIWMQQTIAIEQMKRALQYEVSFARKQEELEVAIERAIALRKSANAERQATPSVSQLLTSISSFLPTDAAIVRLEFDQKQGLVSIEQRSPSNLTSSLARSPLLKDIQFHQSAIPSLTHIGQPGNVIQTFSFTLVAEAR